MLMHRFRFTNIYTRHRMWKKHFIQHNLIESFYRSRKTSIRKFFKSKKVLMWIVCWCESCADSINWRVLKFIVLMALFCFWILHFQNETLTRMVFRTFSRTNTKNDSFGEHMYYVIGTYIRLVLIFSLHNAHIL